MFDWIWWQSTASLQAAVAIYGGGLFLSIIIAKGVSIRRDEMFKVLSGLFMCGVIVVNAASFFISLAEEPTDYARARAITHSFGLTSDQSYPLVVGSRIGGSNDKLTASASGGLFSAHAYVETQSQPASALFLGFTYQNRSYILEVPVSKITFVQSESAVPSVQMHIRNRPFAGAQYDYKYHGHRCGVRNLWAVCLPGPRTSTLNISVRTKRRGLAPLVSKYLDSAIITLTPAMYKEILGAP